MASEAPWRGVVWPSAPGGVCSVHGIPVGPFTNLCIRCHEDQLQAAREGSRRFERPKWAKGHYRPKGLPT